MRTALDDDPSRFGEDDRKFVDNIRQYGWSGTGVLEDEEGPGFNYTTGFWSGLGFPEVVVFSLPHNTAHNTLWHIYNGLKAGRTFAVGEQLDGLFDGNEAVLLPVAQKHFREYLGWSNWFYRGTSFPCLQLIWSDSNRRFPWENGYLPSVLGAQPDLTEGDWAGRRHTT